MREIEFFFWRIDHGLNRGREKNHRAKQAELGRSTENRQWSTIAVFRLFSPVPIVMNVVPAQIAAPPGLKIDYGNFDRAAQAIDFGRTRCPSWPLQTECVAVSNSIRPSGQGGEATLSAVGKKRA